MNNVPIHQINIHDRRFCLTFPLDDLALFDSIRKVGIVQPILLLEASPYLVIAGFKRLAIAQQLGLKEIPCITVHITEREALLLAIYDNIHRCLNLVEKAHAIERMLRVGFAREEIDETMIALEIQPHEKVMKNLIGLACAEDSLKRFVVAHRLPMKIVDYLMRFDIDERSSIMRLLSSFHCTEGTIRVTLESLNLIKVKEGRLPFERLHPANGQDLLKQLKEIAYPALTALQEKLLNICQSSALPPHIDIRVDPFFEKEYIDIAIRAKNKDDIYQALEKIYRLTDDGTLGSMLDLTKGNLR